MKIRVDARADEFPKAFKGIDVSMTFAAQNAIRQATQIAETRGKVDVAASGLGPRWVASLKSRFYVNNGLDAAGIVYSAINYSVVFEKGAEIKGNPTLWLPLPTTPQKFGKKRLTAKLYDHLIGHLFKITIRGKDYLAARVAVSKGQVGKVQSRSVAMLKRKRGKKQVYTLVPLFVAVESTKIKKRLHIGAITEAAAARLPELYAAALKED